MIEQQLLPSPSADNSHNWYDSPSATKGGALESVCSGQSNELVSWSSFIAPGETNCFRLDCHARWQTLTVVLTSDLLLSGTGCSAPPTSCRLCCTSSRWWSATCWCSSSWLTTHTCALLLPPAREWATSCSAGERRSWLTSQSTAIRALLTPARGFC